MASPDRFDGLEVDIHQARFAGTVELDPTDADNMSMDTTFVAVLVCTVGGAAFADNAKGEVVRTNKFKVDHFAVVRDGELQNDLYDKLPALVGAPAVEPDPQMFAPKADDNGEAIAVEAEDDLLKHVDEDDDDNEIFSPGQSRPTSSNGATGRSYAHDPALEAFLS